MQTFVPTDSSNYTEMAKVLDNKRLNKQALEGWQILMTLLELDPEGNPRTPKGWVNHPAVKMWRGHEVSLFNYVSAMVDEWIARGYKSTIKDKARRTMMQALSSGKFLPSTPPAWLVDGETYRQIASTHRQALLVKDYHYYSQFNWPEDTGTEPTEYEYIWPV